MSMLDIYDAATSLGYDHLKAQYHNGSKKKGYVAIEGDEQVLEFVHDIPPSRVQPLCITDKPDFTLLDKQASVSAPVFSFTNLRQPELLKLNVEVDLNKMCKWLGKFG